MDLLGSTVLGGDMISLGQRIRDYRNALNMTQGDLATVIEMSTSYISDIEKDRTEPSLETLRKLAAAFGVSVINVLSGVHGYSQSETESVADLQIQVAQSKALLDIRERIRQLNNELEAIYEKVGK